MSDIQFEIELADGRTAKCWQSMIQPYQNCNFSTGLVENIEPDTLYLCIDRKNEEPIYLFLRPDEMSAIAWLCNGALWSKMMMELAGG